MASAFRNFRRFSQFFNYELLTTRSCNIQKRFLNLQEYQSKQLMQNNGVRVQRFRVVDNAEQASQVVTSKGDGSLDCKEYVIKAQVLAGGRGKGHFKTSNMKGN